MVAIGDTAQLQIYIRHLLIGSNLKRKIIRSIRILSPTIVGIDQFDIH
jgi:hypothetical protein